MKYLLIRENIVREMTGWNLSKTKEMTEKKKKSNVVERKNSTERKMDQQQGRDYLIKRN